MPDPKAFQAPADGDIVWCHFPEDLGNPAPKPRPALVIAAGPSNDDPDVIIAMVAYGTSQKCSPSQVKDYELLIIKDGSSEYESTGLQFTTKFNLKRIHELEFSDLFFEEPPQPKFPGTPKLGVLSPVYLKRLQKAYKAANK